MHHSLMRNEDSLSEVEWNSASLHLTVLEMKTREFR